jgi:cell division protein FtsQ
MDRSLAGRAAIGRSFDPTAPFSKALELARGCAAFLRRRRRLRLGLLAALVAAPLLVGGWLWLRDSSLVAVERVQISGVRGPEAREIEAALGSTALRMSTLDMHPGALTAAVAPYRVVREVRASASFPHGLRIRVVEQLPVAALTVAGGRTAVAADGVVLGPALLSSSLPLLGAGLSAANAPQLLGQRVHGGSLLESLTLLGAAPAPLARAVARVFVGPQGVTAAMRNGLLVYLGDATRAHAKWLSLARVLADQGSAGASYVDVRLPERPAAGFPGTAAPETSAASSQPSSASEPRTAAELAAGLTAALGLSSPGGKSQNPSEASSAPSQAPSEAASGTAASTVPAGAGEASTSTTPEASTSGPTPGG